MKTCSFSSANSHPGRLLTDHLLEVAREADRTMDTWPMALLPEGFRQVALLVCLCHDVGKATPWFQNRLETGKGGPLTRHAELSAAVTRAVLARATESGVPASDLAQAMAVVAVWRHHGNLSGILTGEHSAATLANKARGAAEDPAQPLARQWAVLDWVGMARWIEAAAGDLGISGLHLGDKPATVADLYPRRWRRTLRRVVDRATPDDAVVAQLLFSLLIGADKLDAALYGRIPEVSGTIDVDAVARYRQARFGVTPQKPADRLRDAVWRDVAATLAHHRNKRLFTLTAPTGAGKTLTAIETALALATPAETGAEAPQPSAGVPSSSSQARIIYCLPFTSIVDQNFDVFREVIEHSGATVDSSLLVKHHHLADVTWYKADEARADTEQYEGDLGQLLVESWKSKVVVTTFVQFLEALIGSRNRMLKKLMQLPGAVVLLDEVQSIPRSLWEVVREALVAWSRMAGTRFVLLTATRPLIFRDGDAVELCQHKAEHFAHLDRVTLVPRLESPLTVAAFAEELTAKVRQDRSRSRLVIANTIASARDLYTLLKENGVGETANLVYLSTHLTPRERLRRISMIRANQDHTRPWFVVSTQLVEAGVDISMDEVYRDLAPLDAIIQAAGRCNRSGERGGGRVTVVRLEDDRGHLFSDWIYEAILLQVTRRLLESKQEIPEGEFLSLGETYFKRMWEATASDEDYVEALGALDFSTLENVHVIKKSRRTQSYFVLAEDDLDAEALWERYRAIQDEGVDRSAFLDIKRAFLERVINVTARGPVDEEILPLYPDGDPYYDKEVGYQHGDQAIQIF